jgi:uncharacterized pyridoxamine 5'-phosphate oxidase family protein
MKNLNEKRKLHFKTQNNTNVHEQVQQSPNINICQRNLDG